MAKTYPELPVVPLQQAKTSVFNTNIEKYLGEFNGNLDGNNMPVEALTHSHLALPVLPQDDYSSGGVYKISSRTPTQSYYDSRCYSWESSDIWTPLASIDLSSDNWRRGWNKLEDYSPFTNVPLEFVAREGMLVGAATIDWHHGINRVLASDGDTTFTVWTGGNWWTEWGVFVNNLLVARSGEIYPRRHTTSLPFSVPVGSNPVRIDVRFIANTYADRNDLLLTDPSTLFDVFGVGIWARNQYR
jgi:hypothetical protein